MEFAFLQDPKATTLLVFRLVRVLSILLLIPLICKIAEGAFRQINSSGRDPKVRRGRKEIFMGTIGGLFALIVYLIATNIVAQLAE